MKRLIRYQIQISGNMITSEYELQYSINELEANIYLTYNQIYTLDGLTLSASVFI